MVRAVTATETESALNVVQLVPRLATGGAERSALEIGSALVAAGHRSTIVCAEGPWVPQALEHGSEVVHMPVGRKSPTSLLLVARLRKLFRGLKPDVVHARSRLPAWLSWLALRRLPQRPAFVTTVHGLNSVSTYSAIMLKGDAVIAVSQTTRQHLLQRYPQAAALQIDVIERGIDPLWYRADWQPEPGWKQSFEQNHPQLSQRAWLLLPARGTRLKGHTDALNVVAELRARGHDVGLLLLGVVSDERDRYLQELRHWAAQLQIADRVSFATAAADVRPYYANALAVLQLSTRPETFGRVVAEALAMRRPVLGYDHGGVGELLARHYDFGRVPLGRIDDLADRIEALLTGVNPALDANLPTLAQMQKSTLAVYERLLQRHSAR